MLGAIKKYIKLAAVPGMYAGGIILIFLSIFKEAKWGLYALAFLIPQPNIWHKLYSYPYGKDFIDFIFLAVLLGMFVQKKGLATTGNSTLIMIFLVFSYLQLWNSSIRFSLPVPISGSNIYLIEWKNYAQMILLYFLSLNIMKDESDQKKMVIIITIVLLIISVRIFRDFSAGSSFSYDKRVRGPFYAVGLGPNHLAAYIAYNCALALGLFLCETNTRLRILYISAYLFGLYPLFFAYSRGAYIAAFLVMAIFGILKKRSLLIGSIFILMFYQVLLPSSVVDRIGMTVKDDGTIEHSAGGRLDLWRLAIDVFLESPIIGNGYAGYSLSVGGTTLRSDSYQDSTLNEVQDAHSIYMRILCEYGIIGMFLFILILLKSIWSGFLLFKNAKNSLYEGLGLGFIGCGITMVFVNLFGDRWSYFATGSYFWIVWGLVDRAILNCRNKESKTSNEE